MDRVAVCNAIKKAIQVRNELQDAKAAYESLKSRLGRMEMEYKAAVGQLGTALGDRRFDGVVYDGYLVRLEHSDRFDMIPIYPAMDVSESPPPPSGEAVVVKESLTATKLPKAQPKPKVTAPQIVESLAAVSNEQYLAARKSSTTNPEAPLG